VKRCLLIVSLTLALLLPSFALCKETEINFCHGDKRGVLSYTVIVNGKDRLTFPGNSTDGKLSQYTVRIQSDNEASQKPEVTVKVILVDGTTQNIRGDGLKVTSSPEGFSNMRVAFGKN